MIFAENDAEVFIDGGDTYYEFEINALNTVYEVFYIPERFTPIQFSTDFLEDLPLDGKN